MERIRVWAVGDRLYPHPGGHHHGVRCRFVGRTHVREEIVPKPRHPHSDTHRACFPAMPEGEELFVGVLADGADITPADLHRAITHGDLTDKDPRPASVSEPEPPAPAEAVEPNVIVTDANIAGGQVIQRTSAPAAE